MGQNVSDMYEKDIGSPLSVVVLFFLRPSVPYSRHRVASSVVWCEANQAKEGHLGKLSDKKISRQQL